MKLLALHIALIISFVGHSQTDTITVVFIYGSKPITESESEWFGGKLGGHVGLQLNKDSVFHFNPGGKVSAFQKKNLPGNWVMSSSEQFWCTWGCDSMKTLSVQIPITQQQKSNLTIAIEQQNEHTDFCYAFFGMRCTSSCYYLLSKTGIYPVLGEKKMIRKYFYPRKLRKKLLKDARQKDWTTISTVGTVNRKWDHD